MTGKLRSLKIEADGDKFKAPLKPKIRLSGRWLEQAGFRVGSRVNVTCIAQGKLELNLISQTDIDHL